jgi:hypothetical protein
LGGGDVVQGIKTPQDPNAWLLGGILPYVLKKILLQQRKSTYIINHSHEEQIMNEFLWGVVVGGVTVPFGWVALKWCLRKVKEQLPT